MTKKTEINKTHIIVATIIGFSIIVATYLNISYKNKVFEAEQKEKLEQEQKSRLNKLQLDTCLSDAYDTMSRDWNSACEKQGREKDCTLYGNVPKVIEERWIRNREECFKRYPVE